MPLPTEWPQHLKPLFPSFTPLEIFPTLEVVDKCIHCLDIPSLILLQSFRDYLCKFYGKDIPFLVNHRGLTARGFRTPELNKRIGGALNSMHLKCKAFDVTPIGINTFQLFQQSKRFSHEGSEWNGIIWYKNKNFVHLDTRTQRLEGWKMIRVNEE